MAPISVQETEKKNKITTIVPFSKIESMSSPCSISISGESGTLASGTTKIIENGNLLTSDPVTVLTKITVPCTPVTTGDAKKQNKGATEAVITMGVVNGQITLPNADAQVELNDWLHCIVSPYIDVSFETKNPYHFALFITVEYYKDGQKLEPPPHTSDVNWPYQATVILAPKENLNHIAESWMGVRGSDKMYICRFGTSTEPMLIISDKTSVIFSSPQEKIEPMLIYPNPAQNYANIEYCLQKDASVTLEIFNSYGIKMKTVLDHEQQSANLDHTISINTNDLPSGVYFARLTAGTESYNQKFSVLK